MKSTTLKQTDVVRKWHLIDATDKSLGRLAVCIANLLRGRGKVTYTPYIDGGDFVVVVNAEKVKLTGAKEENKIYQRFSGYRSGLKEFTAATVREQHPDRLVRLAVRGMLPRNRQSRQVFTRLKVYAGDKHPHEAQAPQAVEL